MTIKDIKKRFKEYLVVTYPEMASASVASYSAMAFYAFNHDMGFSFFDAFESEESFELAKEQIFLYLQENAETKNESYNAKKYIKGMELFYDFLQYEKNRGMPIETDETAIEDIIYEQAKKVYLKQIGVSEAVKHLVSIDNNYSESTYIMTINAFIDMIEGRLFRRSLTYRMVELFIRKISNDFGAEARKKALKATLKNLNYYYEKTNQPLKEHRIICQRISDEFGDGFSFEVIQNDGFSTEQLSVEPINKNLEAKVVDVNNSETNLDSFVGEEFNMGNVETEKVKVGKYTLESLTTGMYSEPQIVYREYIQNSVDSLENAIAEKLIDERSMRIDIVISNDDRTITIKDNGTGIKSSVAKQTLLNVGNSKKRNSTNRGFRGIGRLGGMGYCETLTFETSFYGEMKKTSIVFDCKELRKLLLPGQNEDMTLEDVLDEITTISFSEEKADKHYFMVKMEGVNPLSDLLDIDEAKSYISQVAPLPYLEMRFIYSKELHKFLADNNYIVEEFPVFVGENQLDLEAIYKPNRSRFHSDRNKMKSDDISKMNYFTVVDEGELLALGWYGDCSWYGSLSEPEISGIRIRKGNILIGDNKTLNTIFKEPRFNGWTQGELFVVSDKLIPNARRDDFEKNEYYYRLINSLRKEIGVQIPRKIRESSGDRNDPSSKVLKDVEKKIDEAVKNVNEGFNSNVDKEKLLDELKNSASTLQGIRVKENFGEKKEQLQAKLAQAIEDVTDSSNYKLNQVNSGIDKKSKKILSVVSDILSNKLSKFLVDEIIEEIIKELNGK